MNARAKAELEPGRIIAHWFEQHQPGTDDPQEIDLLHHDIFQPRLDLGIAAVGLEKLMDTKDILLTIMQEIFTDIWDSSKHGWEENATLVDINTKIEAFSATNNVSLITELLSRLRREGKEVQLIQHSLANTPLT